MSSKKNNNRPTRTNASPGTPRRAGSPVEAARKSFVVEDAATTNETTVPEPAPAAAATSVKTSPAATPAARTTPGSLKNAPQAVSSRRQAQLERQKRRRRQQIITWSIIGVVVLLIIGGITAWIIAGAPKTLDNGVVQYGKLAQDHVTTSVNYDVIPPVGGPHNPVWQNCGIYDKPITNENGVHSLEHGAVWITYQPNLPADAVEKLRAQVRGKGYILLTPYTGLNSPVVASAWGVQLKLDSASDPRLATFISTYRSGPQTPEPGAACTGGVGTPIEL